MTSSESEFIQYLILQRFGGFNSQKEFIERLLIGALIDSYHRIDKSIGHENQIRDRFAKDIHETDSHLKKLIGLNELDFSWEKWVFTPDLQLARTDITFKTFGIQFIIECKRLKAADKAYIEEGLNRFINLKYAKGDEYAGMIGFIIGGDAKAISKGLQDKINRLSHTKSVNRALLDPFFNSLHLRNNNSQIEIYHLFFDFNMDPNIVRLRDF